MRISVTLTNIFSVLTQCFNMFYSVHISLCGNDACKNNVQSIKFHINMCLLRQLNGSSVYHGTNRINVVFKSIIPRLTKSSITHKIRNTTCLLWCAIGNFPKYKKRMQCIKVQLKLCNEYSNKTKMSYLSC